MLNVYSVALIFFSLCSSGKVPYLLICMKDSYIFTLFIQWGLDITGDGIKYFHPVCFFFTIYLVIQWKRNCAFKILNIRSHIFNLRA